MNTDTNHLIRVLEGEEMPAGYQEVPAELHKAAYHVMRGRDEAYVSKHSGGKLSRWAAGRRKAKRKMAEASRKRNRER